MIAHQVDGDARQPGAQARVAAKLVPRAPGLEEAFLGKRLGGIAVRQRRKQKTQDAGPVDAHDFVEVGQLQHRLLSFVDGELVACDLFHAIR